MNSREADMVTAAAACGCGDVNHNHPSPRKLAITIDLDDLSALVKEYLAHLPPRDRLETQLRFSHLLIWARKRQEQQRQEGANSEQRRD